ncbi:50S ribosomal protein L22 [Candidatus Woesearchaeota archaeon]|nr:50S ribosomal protein L22 [Candidatus Woesearchaeota archaeon]
MAKHNYSCKIQENMAKAVGRDLDVSKKHAVEICSFLRGKPLERAKIILQEVTEKKQAVPFKRHKRDIPHRTKIGPGRFPVKASQRILKILESVTANAQNMGLATGKLEICHINAHQASRPARGGRQRGRTLKRTHVEVVVREALTKKTERSKAKTEKNEKEQKAEEKTAKPAVAPAAKTSTTAAKEGNKK